jgi:CPA1 family monovalent cation:H+ antiporter
VTSETLLTIVEITILMTAVAVIVGIIAGRLRMPYTVGLVVVGSLVFAGVSWLRQFHIEELPPLFSFILEMLDAILELETETIREAILVLLVPPLIFEAAFHLRFKKLARDLPTILLFAIPGVLITTLLVGWVVARGTGLGFETAVVFGALIAATDPVAVIALFRSLGAPKRLAILLEGESLLNDGAAIVIFTLALGIATGKTTFSLGSSILDFFIVAGGGLVIGGTMGWLFSKITSRLDDPLIQTAITFSLAFGSYLLAENFHVSGVLATVAAGLVLGNLGPRHMSPTTRLTIAGFWEFTAFLANSVVFLLISLVVDFNTLIANWQSILLAIGVVLVVRLLVIFAFSAVTRTISIRWQFVLVWGGLRGAISLALALGLGNRFAELQAMAFGVVLFSLLVQGTTMGPILRQLNIIQVSQSRLEYERKQALNVANRAAFNRLETIFLDGSISKLTWDTVSPILLTHADEASKAAQDLLHADTTVAAEERDIAWREALRAQKDTLNRLLSDGVISEESFAEIVSGIDMALNQSQIGWRAIEDMKAGLGLSDT